MFILLDRGIPSIHFEYITASKRDLVTEICKPEVTEPRNGKVIFKKFIVNILMHVCMFMTIECKFVKKVPAKKDLSFCSTSSNLVNLCKLPKKMFSISWSSNFSFTYLSYQILLRGRSTFKTTGRNPSFQQYNHQFCSFSNYGDIQKMLRETFFWDTLYHIVSYIKTYIT